MSCTGLRKRWLILAAAAALALPLAAADTPAREEERDEPAFLYRFRDFTKPTAKGSTPASAEDGGAHGALSDADFKAAIDATRDFWNSNRSNITHDTVIKLFETAKHFSVVHALLETGIINSSESATIGRLRAEIHQMVLDDLASSGRYGKRLGVNDFGTVGNAKSDIDFTPYAEGIEGERLLAAYEEAFVRRTGGVRPGQMDIVAHKHEAVIPDWRKTKATADFVAELRNGRSLLRANHEAYFLEGAYHQQVMGRSADGTTLTWIELDDDGTPRRTASNAAADPEFFYFKPEVRQRYAWGGALGNWHFYHAHANDKVARAKYLLRSMDDGARLAMISNTEVKTYKKFESLTPAERARVIDQLYRGRVPEPVKRQFLAVMETAAQIRDLKAKGLATDSADAYRALIDLDRSAHPDFGEALLLERAKANMDRVGSHMLLENNVIAAETRLRDWLAPDLKTGEFDTVTSQGRKTKVTIDRGKVERLQMSAFFELHDGLGMLSDDTIRRIKSENPRFASDIDILTRVIEKKRQMALAPERYHPDGSIVDPTETRRGIADEILADYDRLQRVRERGGRMAFYRELGGTAWRRGQEFEDRLQRNLVNALAWTVSGGDSRLIGQLDRMRASVEIANERFLGPRYMLRMAKANSILEVLKTYVREGEVNRAVVERAIYEGLSYVPGIGTLMTLQGGTEGVIVLASTQLIPGYGQILLTLQVAKGTVELVGLTIFEPLRDDRIVLAYQGYLAPAEGGLVTSGQSERVESRVPSILLPIDPDGSMSLEERRAAIYDYFHDNITATISKDPNFPFTEDEWPHEWLEQEQRWLEVRLRQHVLDWWNASGRFEGYDEILAFRSKLLGMSEEEFRRNLEQRLWKDYWTGRQIALEKMVKEREAGFDDLEEKVAQVLAVDEGLRRQGASLQETYEQNGQLIYASMLEEMPREPVSLEIIAAPNVQTLELEGYDEEEVDLVPAVSFRAEVHGSTEDHPYPWSITWQIDGPESLTFDPDSSEEIEVDVGEDPGSWPVSVTAIARDAENRTIAQETLQLAIEKLRFGDEADEEDDDEEEAGEGGDEGDGIPGDDADEAVDPIAVAAAAADDARTAADEATAACDDAASEIAVALSAIGELEGQLGELEGRLDTFAGKVERLDTLLAQAQEGAREADMAARELADLRDRMAALRDDACGKADAIAAASTVGEQDRLLEAVRSAVNEARTLAKTVPRLLSRVGNGAREAREAKDEAEGLRAELEEINALLGELGPSQAEALAAVDRARAALAATAGAEERIAEAAARAESATALAADGGSPEAIAEAQRLEEAVTAAAAAVQECRDSAGADADRASEGLAEIGTRSTTARDRLTALRTALASGDLEASEAAAAEAEATLSIVEPFAASIIGRADDIVVCGEIGEGNALVPPAGGDAGDPGGGEGTGGSSGGSDWTATSEVETVGTGESDGPAEPAPPPSDPVIDSLIAQAGAAFSRCDFGTARALADRIAERNPSHPWLASNYAVIIENERRQNAALAALRRAESAVAAGDLATARAAAQEAAMSAPFCMVDRVTGLVATIDDHIARERERERIAEAEARDRNRAGIASGLGTLISAIGAVAGAVSGEGFPVPALPTPGGGGGSGGGPNLSDPCTYKWSFANVYSTEPTCDCPGYEYRGVCVPGSGGGGSGGGGGVPGATEPVTDKDEGTVNVPSRNVRVCVTDVNSVLDDQYNLVINGGFVGGISNAEGGSTCYNAMLRGGSNRVELRLVAARGKSTYLQISMTPGDYSASFGGTHNHVWTVVAP